MKLFHSTDLIIKSMDWVTSFKISVSGHYSAEKTRKNVSFWNTALLCTPI